MGLNHFSSDYRSGSSMKSSTSWGIQEMDYKTFQPKLLCPETPRPKAASFADLAYGRCSIDDVMKEFRMNGSDSPYNPEDDQIWNQLSDMNGYPSTSAANYKRQTSWPAPKCSPRQRLARPISASFQLTTPPATVASVARNEGWPEPGEFYTSVPNPRPLSASFAEPTIVPTGNEEVSPSSPAWAELSEEQRGVLRSLPDAVLYCLLLRLQPHRAQTRQPEECRFCKNNGERASYYRSHVLKDGSGRVCCPVLRALVCRRCGASGDRAHTIKYCPYSTSEERMKSAAMMRSVRMASGRRRAAAAASNAHSDYYSLLCGNDNYPSFSGQNDYNPPLSGQNNYTTFSGHSDYILLSGQPTAPAAVRDDTTRLGAPLDPSWAALEQKLTR